MFTKLSSDYRSEIPKVWEQKTKKEPLDIIDWFCDGAPTQTQSWR